MKFIKQDLLTLLIGLFLLASCKSTTTIGFEPEGDATVKGTLDNSVTVNSATLAEDPTSGVSLIRHPLGSLNDTELGTTDASLAMSVSLPNIGYDFGNTPVLDSAVLVLPYSTQFYGDTVNTNYTFTVKQLANDLSQERNFLTSKEWPTGSEVLGTLTSKIKPKTPINITDIVTGAADTLKSVVPQIRIKLSNTTIGSDFITNNILKLDSITLARNERFFARFKGLQVTATKSGGDGGIMFINFTGSDAKIELYYTRKNETTATNIDTVAVNFPIVTTTGPVTATIKHTYSAKVNDQLSNSAGAFNVTYLQPLAGLRNKISFPDLQQFVTRAKGTDVNSRIVINRAELVVPIANGTDVAPLTAAPRLSLYRTDIAGISGNIPDNDAQTQTNPGEPFRYAGSEAAFGGFYDTTNKRYIFTVTAYLQDLIDKKTEDYGTYLAPSSVTEFNISPSVTSAARAIITTKTPAGGDIAIKLNIYYTKVN